MRITDKRNGEPVGRVLAHPLQAKVDEIVYSKLGDRKYWRNGDEIKASYFSSINNKSYLNKRLSDLNLSLDVLTNRYVVSGIKSASYQGVRPKPQQAQPKPEKVEPKPSIKPHSKLVEIRLSEDANRPYIRKLLDDGCVISNRQLSGRDRQRFSSVVSDLRRVCGMSILTENISQVDGRYTVHSTNKVAFDEYVEANTERPVGIKVVRSHLVRFGEISSKESGICQGSLSSHIKRLRSEGWKIRTISKPNSRATYKLISKP